MISRREKSSGFIWAGLRSFNYGDFRVSFLAVYRRESGFSLKGDYALPFWIENGLTYASKMPKNTSILRSRGSLWVGQGK